MVEDESVPKKRGRKPKIVEENPEVEEKIPKKRGRKPKGGKLITENITSEITVDEKPTIVLHLKCSIKDIKNQTHCEIESYNDAQNVYEFVEPNANSYEKSKVISVDDNICKDATKEIWRKMKILENNLHTNNVNQRSACFWDTCEFDNPPVHIPKNVKNGIYQVYGCFCSPECATAFLMNESLDSSVKYERYHLLNSLYSKIYNYSKNIKPSGNPHYMLEKFCGNLSIQEYRSLLNSDRLFMVVDKPLTKVFPEMHEDNDDFLLNSKLIPSNITAKRKSHKNKSEIIHEKFGTC